MKFEVSRRESRRLMHLIYLGNHVMNNESVEEIKNPYYDNLAQELFLQYLTLQQNIDKQLRTLITDLCWETFDGQRNYEEYSFYKFLADILTDKYYPFNTENEHTLHESIQTHTLARHAYLDMLCKQGYSFIKFSAPLIDDNIQKLKKERNKK